MYSSQFSFLPVSKGSKDTEIKDLSEHIQPFLSTPLGSVLNPDLEADEPFSSPLIFTESDTLEKLF